MRRKQKNNSNKGINIAIAVVIVGLVAALAVMVTGNTQNKPTNGGIVKGTYSDYAELMPKDEYSIFLLTSPTCGHCQNYKPAVNLAANELGFKVYDLNVNELSGEEFIHFHDKYTALMEQYNGEHAIIPTPTTIITRNGNEVVSILGDIKYDGFMNLLEEYNVIEK